MQPYELARIFDDAGWEGAKQLVEIVAVSLAESQGYTHAVNDNLDKNGEVLSRDCGVLQYNIPASAVGTQRELELYDPVKNAAAGFVLYKQRGLQPWVAYNRGIAMDQRWWTAEGKPTGRYLYRAMHGVRRYLTEKTGSPLRFDWYIPSLPVPIS